MTAPAVENPFAGQGSVLLDIGDDVGALVVTTPASMVGVEVEIRPADPAPHGHGHASHHPHVAVVLRPTGDTLVPSLVYPDLVEGRYELYVKDTDAVELTATVVGGEVATAEWPG